MFEPDEAPRERSLKVDVRDHDMSRIIADDETYSAVLAAFDGARRNGRTSAECYRAGVLAWRERHPDQAPEYAAKHAVALILSKERGNMLRVKP
jgi:hypothetical protein